MKSLRIYLTVFLVTIGVAKASLDGYYQNDFDPNQSSHVSHVHCAGALYSYKKNCMCSKMEVDDCLAKDEFCFVKDKKRPDKNVNLYVEYKTSGGVNGRYNSIQRYIVFNKKDFGWETVVLCHISKAEQGGDLGEVIKKIQTDQLPSAFVMRVVNSTEKNEIDVAVELKYPEETKYVEEDPTPINGDLIVFE